MGTTDADGSRSPQKHLGSGGGGSGGGDLETLNELIRNITQLAAKSNGHRPIMGRPSDGASTTRVIGDDNDKMGNRSSTPDHPSSSNGTYSSPLRTSATAIGRLQMSTVSAEEVTRTPPATAVPLVSVVNSEGSAAREVHTEVDKDNKKIEVVYAESATEAQKPAKTDNNEEDDAEEKRSEGNRIYGDDRVAAEATAQPAKTTAALVQFNDDGDGSRRNQSPPAEVTTPLTPSHRREQQRLLLKKHLYERNSLLSVLNATRTTAGDNNATLAAATTTADEAGLSISQRELARVAGALKALRNLAAQCNNKCNGSSINGVVSSKCLNRTRTTTTFAVERRNRVENVLAKTHEEVAARTMAESSRRLRKLRVCARTVKGERKRERDSWIDSP